jgi:type I restriction enzyme S subunit
LLLNINWGSLNSTTITRIYGSDLRSLSLTFPIDPQEQQKIADCLSSIADRITAETQKLDTLKAHKKG